jgi:ATP-binding protein involved in chromosome partitioning
MKKIATFSVKGGVGKSTTSAGLCQGLTRLGFKNRVGYMEIDISGTSGHRAFGIDPPRVLLDTEREKLIPPLVNGIRMFPLASKFSENACVGWQSVDKELILSDGNTVINKGRTEFLKAILTKVTDWQDTEWLVLDLPPSTSEETFAFFECVPDLYGVILVSQPSEIACVGLMKTIDFLKNNRKPILGLVENMAMCLCPYCEKEFYPFTSKGVDLKKLARDEDIPFLISLPQVDAMVKLDPYFDKLAKYVVEHPGKIIGQSMFSPGAKFKRKALKTALNMAARLLPKGN